MVAGTASGLRVVRNVSVASRSTEPLDHAGLRGICLAGPRRLTWTPGPRPGPSGRTERPGGLTPEARPEERARSGRLGVVRRDLAHPELGLRGLRIRHGGRGGRGGVPVPFQVVEQVLADE